MQQSVDERVGVPGDASFPAVFVKEAGELQIVVVLDAGKFLYEASAQAYAIRCRCRGISFAASQCRTFASSSLT